MPPVNHSLHPDPKDMMRIRDIVRKSKGNKDKIISLSQTMSNKITDYYKAARRAIAADIVAREALADIEIDVFLALIESSNIFLNGAGSYAKAEASKSYTFCTADDANSKDSVNDMVI